MPEDKLVGWHHRLDGHEFDQALGVGDGQGSLACCSPRGCKQSDMTELNYLLLFSTLLFMSDFSCNSFVHFDIVHFILYTFIIGHSDLEVMLC